MTTRLTWTTSPAAACLHAAAHLAAGRAPVLPGIADALSVPAAALRDFALALGLAPPRLFAELVPAAGTIESNRQLAHAALTTSLGRDHADIHAEHLAGLIADCEAPYFVAFPKLTDELELRLRPLRELWETRGPGMLAGVGRRTDKRLIVEEARVVVVPPYLGGGGRAAPRTNLVVIEAVLANPIGDLPETLRLGWLTSQLAADLPDFAEAVSPKRAPELIAWAMLPAVLDAAADVELIRPPDDELLQTAAEAWLPDAVSLPTLPVNDDTLTALAGWWEAAGKNPSAPFVVKLRALEQLLDEA